MPTAMTYLPHPPRVHRNWSAGKERPQVFSINAARPTGLEVLSHGHTVALRHPRSKAQRSKAAWLVSGKGTKGKEKRQGKVSLCIRGGRKGQVHNVPSDSLLGGVCFGRGSGCTDWEHKGSSRYCHLTSSLAVLLAPLSSICSSLVSWHLAGDCLCICPG